MLDVGLLGDVTSAMDGGMGGTTHPVDDGGASVARIEASRLWMESACCCRRTFSDAGTRELSRARSLRMKSRMLSFCNSSELPVPGGATPAKIRVKTSTGWVSGNIGCRARLISMLAVGGRYERTRGAISSRVDRISAASCSEPN